MASSRESLQLHFPAAKRLRPCYPAAESKGSRPPGLNRAQLRCKIACRIFPSENYETHCRFSTAARLERCVVASGSDRKQKHWGKWARSQEGRQAAAKSFKENCQETAESREEISKGAAEGIQANAASRLRVSGFRMRRLCGCKAQVAAATIVHARNLPAGR